MIDPKLSYCFDQYVARKLSGRAWYNRFPPTLRVVGPGGTDSDDTEEGQAARGGAEEEVKED